jgi:LmbE family N-acetylglucosaminyl deacetylase
MKATVFATLVTALTLSCTSSLFAQESDMEASALAHAVDRLGNTGRVLYVAAHPDDENTRLLAYLSNDRHYTAAYLSMTRGGGGQNLIGREQDELLDVLRTEELLAARAIDGAQQFFTRMRDFGYSKSAAETLDVWGKEDALADVVWVIRSFQPDVIITRFDELPPNHGHHTASAILAREAFSAAADPKRFPEQLTLGVKVWQARRLLLNVPHWRKEPPVPANALKLDVGTYDARFGMSLGELAARSRTQHKSQGFGIQGERGELIESLVPVLGEAPTQDLMEGIDSSWARYGQAGQALGAALAQVRAKLHRDFPERTLPALLEALRACEALPQDDVRVRDTRASLLRVIAAVSGTFVRATATVPSGVAGQAVPVRVEIVPRRTADLLLKQVVFPDASLPVNETLAQGKKREITRDMVIAKDAPVSSPYWLQDPSLSGRQVLREPRLLGAPVGSAPLSVRVEVTLAGQAIAWTVPLQYVWTDRVHGERMRTFLVTPPATLTPERDAVVFPNGRSAAVVLRVRAGKEALSGQVRLGLPDGYKCKPASHAVQLAKAGDETLVRFDVTPPKAASPVVIAPVFEADGQAWSFRQDTIDYPHVPMQVVLRPAKLRLVTAQLVLPKGPIGYIEGSGDTVAGDLAHLGIPVTLLDDEALRTAKLERFPAILVGIRAYNTRAALLMQYVESGGTLLVQYNTHSGFSPLELPVGPYPLEIGRDRATDETAHMRALQPRSALVRKPHVLGPADFEGWVQERGLYFGMKWDPKYEPVFEIADPGEAPSRGAVLVAKHGKGRYVYTGLAFFRQLPAGVPGAYRLLLNLIAR